MPPPTPESSPQSSAEDKNAVLQRVDWTDFRDHIATADRSGRRKWLFPRKPQGRLYNLRTAVNFVLLAIMFIGPFVRIDGSPLLMMNIVDRRFVILGQTFWPQDLPIFAIAFLIFLTGIAIFTAAFGRLWCGWTCPQTVLMEGVFRKLEYWIEGDAHAQRALSTAPWNSQKLLKRGGKHLLFLGLSFVIGNTLLAYIIGSDALLQIITDPPTEHIRGLTFMILFTLVFYGIFARFREQACTFICPYGRFQSTLLDENTIVVAYDHKRGENRGVLRRKDSAEARKASGLGDCVDCHQCVNVCPTGIDIRDGTQMECVNCTACIDACDEVMDKIGRPRGLIRYASLDGIERQKPLRFTPRMAAYSAILVALISLFLYLLFTRTDVQTTLLRAPGSLAQQMPDGRIANLYTVKLVNKTHRDIPVSLRLEDSPGNIRLMGQQSLVVPAERLLETSVLIEIDPADLQSHHQRLRVGVYSGETHIETLKTFFIGPRHPLATPP